MPRYIIVHQLSPATSFDETEDLRLARKKLFIFPIATIQEVLPSGPTDFPGEFQE